MELLWKEDHSRLQMIRQKHIKSVAKVVGTEIQRGRWLLKGVVAGHRLSKAQIKQIAGKFPALLLRKSFSFKHITSL